MQVGKAQFSGANNYAWLLNHDVPGILANRFDMRRLHRRAEPAADRPDLGGLQLQRGGRELVLGRPVEDARWPGPTTWKRPTTPRSSASTSTTTPARRARGVRACTRSMHTDYLSQLELRHRLPEVSLRQRLRAARGCSTTTPRSPGWPPTSTSPPGSATPPRRSRPTAPTPACSNATEHRARPPTSQANGFSFLPCEVNQPDTANRCNTSNDANWASQALWSARTSGTSCCRAAR